jgi:hypothetical protein
MQTQTLPKKPQKLPVVLSPEEVAHFLRCVNCRKHRVILTICYAAGLRISEAWLFPGSHTDRPITKGCRRSSLPESTSPVRPFQAGHTAFAEARIRCPSARIRH